MIVAWGVDGGTPSSENLGSDRTGWGGVPNQVSFSGKQEDGQGVSLHVKTQPRLLPGTPSSHAAPVSGHHQGASHPISPGSNLQVNDLLLLAVTTGTARIQGLPAETILEAASREG